jgi:hypothetical protein
MMGKKMYGKVASPTKKKGAMKTPTPKKKPMKK